MNLKGALAHSKRAPMWLRQMLNLLIAQLGVILGLQLDSVTNIAALAAVDDLRIPDGSRKLVRTVKDTWTLDKTSAAVVDGISVIATASATGRWVRDIKPSIEWAQQGTWFIDAVNGNDENDGYTDSTELKTWGEFRRRVEIHGLQVFMWINVETDLDPADDIILECDGGQGMYIVGIPTVAYSGTIAAGGWAFNPATNVPPSMVDNGWTVADHMHELVRFTSGGADGGSVWILEDLGGGQARTSAPTDGYGYPATPAAGDTFEVLTLPRIAFDMAGFIGFLTVVDIEYYDWKTNNGRIYAPYFWAQHSKISNSVQGYAEITNCMGRLWANEGAELYIYAGAFRYLSLHSATGSWGAAVTLDDDVPIAWGSGIELGVNSSVEFGSDLWIFGDAGSYSINMYEGSVFTFYSTPYRFRGTPTGVKLAYVAPGAQLLTEATNHTATILTVFIAGSSLDVELDTETPITDPHSKAVVGIGSDAGVSGVVKAGIKGNLTATGAPTTYYALQDFTESATDVIQYVVTNRSIMQNLRVHLLGDLSTDTLDVTMLVNGAASTLTVTGITGNVPHDYRDITHAVLVEPGDLVTFEVVRTGGAGAGNNMTLSVEVG
jgi:hypothetical protein